MPNSDSHSCFYHRTSIFYLFGTTSLSGHFPLDVLWLLVNQQENPIGRNPVPIGTPTHLPSSNKVFNLLLPTITSSANKSRTNLLNVFRCRRKTSLLSKTIHPISRV